MPNAPSPIYKLIGWSKKVSLKFPIGIAPSDRLSPIALRRWRKTPFTALTRKQWKTYRTLLQSEQYDAVIDAQGLLKSALFATRLARGTRHGYDRHSIREPIAACFYDKKYAISYQQHAVERIRQLFAQSLNYPLPHTQGDYGIARHFPQHAQTMPYVLFFHGTTRQDKFLPDRQWRTLAEKLTAQGIQIHVPWSNPQEKQRAERIAQGLDLVTILPKIHIIRVSTADCECQRCCFC